jgi:uncharacterized membrane protein
MNLVYPAAAIFLLVFFAGILSKNPLIRKLAAVVLFMVVAIGVTLFFEVGVRIVLEDAHRSGELSNGFVLGVRRLSGWFTWGRIIAFASALGLLIMILRKPPN